MLSAPEMLFMWASTLPLAVRALTLPSTEVTLTSPLALEATTRPATCCTVIFPLADLRFRLPLTL